MSHAHENHYGEPGAQHEAVPIDPEHDIDARSATLWVVGGAIVLFLSLWVMVPIFMRIQEAERAAKVETAPNLELEQVLAGERKFLDGSNPTGRSIESVIKQRGGN